MTVSFSGLAYSLAASSLLPYKDIDAHLHQAKSEQKPFTTYLVQQGLISSIDLAQFCSREFALELFDLSSFEIASIPEEFLNLRLIEKHHALPLYKQGQTIFIAMADPANAQALEDFGFSFNLSTEVLLVEESRLSKALEEIIANGSQVLDALGMEEMDLEVSDDPSRLEEAANNTDDDAPIVKFINQILSDAIRKGASDIHFEPYEYTYRVRFRIDGILHEMVAPPVAMANRFSARLKVMSKLDIAERRVPQDGRIKLKVGRNQSIDLRVSTLPTMWGEKVVMRVLDSSAASLDIDKLGYNNTQKALYMEALEKPQGMILITGPTGSGKTVSLYTGLNILNTPERNISTAEDPVEINLAGINQVQINNKAGLTFAGALRAFLRQDPDIVMVGEIRDLETAEIGIKAAQTGHLVLSTLHTNSAAETLTRMLNMGVPAFNIGSSVTLIIAQRLARRLCPHCKQAAETLPEPEYRKLGFTEQQIGDGIRIFEPVGCDQCTDGFKGRVGIYEVMPMSEGLSRLILEGANSLELSNFAQDEGMLTLRMSALEKALEGVTSLSEVTRVTNK